MKPKRSPVAYLAFLPSLLSLSGYALSIIVSMFVDANYQSRGGEDLIGYSYFLSIFFIFVNLAVSVLPALVIELIWSKGHGNLISFRFAVIFNAVFSAISIPFVVLSLMYAFADFNVVFRQ